MQERRNNNCCVTISTQRSGTKLLGSCFNKGTEVLSVGEIFHDKSSSPLSLKNYVLRHPDFGPRYVVGQAFEMLDDYFSELQGLYPCIHFDVMYSNMTFFGPLWWDQPAAIPLLQYFRSRNFAVIHLQRSPADCYVSALNAEFTGKYHQTADGSVTRDSSAAKEIQEMDSLVAAFGAFDYSVRANGKLVDDNFQDYSYYCKLKYEDLLEDGEGMLTDETRRKIAAVIVNGCSPESLQHRGVDLVRSVKAEFASDLAKRLRKSQKNARRELS